MKTIAFANQKGGVGKTTCARGFLFYAIQIGLRVLCVDLDPQRNLTNTLNAVREKNYKDAPMPRTVLNASSLFEGGEVTQHLEPLDCGPGVGLIAADLQLLDVASKPLSELGRPRETLSRFADRYDVCIVDTAPTLGNPLYAALIASDGVVCPCTMDQDALNGLADLYEDIGRVRQIGWNKDLQVLGLLPNRINGRRAYDVHSLEQLREEMGSGVFENVLFDRAATQYAKNNPISKEQNGQSQRLAAREMAVVCNEILVKMQINTNGMNK